MSDIHTRGEPSMTIGGLAKAAEVHVETIRLYQRKGLMPEPLRRCGGIRRYAEADRSRLHFIKSAQRLGFSLDEIAELLQLDDGASCVQARTKAQAKLADVRARLEDLRRMEGALEELIRLCGASRGKVPCPLIAALEGLHQIVLVS
ncbi:MAG: MerR family DNA-binding protein [Hydrogenophaga sp.]|jgi:MerR family mercuric resistance operon transcriptional regulator|uniref:MerR family transcriptional regulator n=1 Tax=Hydrogenophaga sp. TaxID=1904254 RepID=UPI001DFF445D|nr:MerR family DNA-binding protein [Hydrogenophaga sp.]MBW0170219.1 MerR family DNA-binding protein [Hydrogenophaga sp.]MBW0182377.1 MerR family DNA-binding protein [Hydrogenophaga sp.]